MDFPVQTVRIFSSDIEIQFGISKCGIVVVQSEGIKLLNGETIKSLEDKKGYKYRVCYNLIL